MATYIGYGYYGTGDYINREISRHIDYGKSEQEYNDRESARIRQKLWLLERKNERRLREFRYTARVRNLIKI